MRSIDLRPLGLDDGMWRQFGPESFWPAAAIAGAAAATLAINRIGGLVVQDFAAFVRLALAVVYGWIAIATALWLLSGEGNPRTRRDHLARSLTLAGFAHAPLLLFGLMALFATGLFDVQGPGLITAVFVGGFWFPAMVFQTVRHTWKGQSVARHGAATAVVYLAWAVLVGRYLVNQLSHTL